MQNHLHKGWLWKLFLAIGLWLSLLLLFSSAPVSATVAPPQSLLPQLSATKIIFGNGPWVVKAYFNDRAQVDQLAGRYEPWEVHYDQGYLVIGIDQAGYDYLLALGFRVEIDQAQTQALLQPPQAGSVQTTEIPGYACYRTVEETYASAQKLADEHPTLAQWIKIGESWEKVTPGGLPGYDLMVLRLTNSAIPGPKPKIFIMASIHAREYTPAELATRFGEYLIQQYGKNPDVTWLLDYHEIHLLLESNPDGRKHAEISTNASEQWWRKNTNSNYCSQSPYDIGADLNRNFDFSWNYCNGHGIGGCSSGNPCDDTYRGPSVASEPETQAIQTYILSQFPDQRDTSQTGTLLTAVAPITTTGVFIDLHSYSDLVIWPWGFQDSPAPNGNSLATLGRKFAYFNQYTPEQSAELYLTDGATDDFAYGTLGIAAFSFELGRSTFFEDCNTFTNTTLPLNMPALLYAVKVARYPYMLPAGPEILNPVMHPLNAHSGDSLSLTATVDGTRFNQSNGTEPTYNVTGSEYYIDNPPWITTTVAISHTLTAQDGSFNSKVENIGGVVDTTGLEQGRHLLFIHGKNTLGNWGPFSAVFFYVYNHNNYFPAINH